MTRIILVSFEKKKCNKNVNKIYIILSTLIMLIAIQLINIYNILYRQIHSINLLTNIFKLVRLRKESYIRFIIESASVRL